MENERLRIQGAKETNGNTATSRAAEKACKGEHCNRSDDCQCARTAAAMLNDPVAFNLLFRSL